MHLVYLFTKSTSILYRRKSPKIRTYANNTGNVWLGADCFELLRLSVWIRAGFSGNDLSLQMMCGTCLFFPKTQSVTCARHRSKAGIGTGHFADKNLKTSDVFLHPRLQNMFFARFPLTIKGSEYILYVYISTVFYGFTADITF